MCGSIIYIVHMYPSYFWRIARTYQATIEDYGVGKNGIYIWSEYVWPIAFSLTLSSINSALVQVCQRINSYTLSISDAKECVGLLLPPNL